MNEVGLVVGLLTFILWMCIASYFKYLMMKSSCDRCYERNKKWHEAWKKSNDDHEIMIHQVLRALPPDKRAEIEGGLDLMRALVEIRFEKENDKKDKK